jgi:hypothetical protein
MWQTRFIAVVSKPIGESRSGERFAVLHRREGAGTDNRSGLANFLRRRHRKVNGHLRFALMEPYPTVVNMLRPKLHHIAAAFPRT